MSYVIIDDATKILKNTEVLSHISLTMEKGGTYGFCGRNASGKTMLFRAISGLITLTKGSITVGGMKIGTDCEFPPSMGLIIENTALWDDLTGMENLRQLASIQKKADDNKIRDTLLAVGLNPEEKKKYRKYSLGMKQKLAIAQAVMEEPELIILDEPTNSLDEESVERLKALLRREHERGATILISSHIHEDLEEICDRIYRLDCGKLVDEDEF